MLKVSSINHSTPTFRANDSHKTSSNRYITKDDFISRGCYPVSINQGFPVKTSAKILNLGVLGKTLLKLNKVYCIPKNAQSLVKRSEKVYAKAQDIIGESMSKISEAIDFGDDKKIVEEFSDGKNQILIKRTTIYSNGTILIDDSKNKMRIAKAKNSIDVSVGVDYDHIAYDSIYSKETFGFTNDKLTGYMSNVQIGLDGYGVEAGEYINIADNKINQYAKNFQQSVDGDCSAELAVFFDKDENIQKSYTDYVVYSSGGIAAFNFYNVKNGKIESCTREYVEYP